MDMLSIAFETIYSAIQYIAYIENRYDVNVRPSHSIQECFSVMAFFFNNYPID